MKLYADAPPGHFLVLTQDDLFGESDGHLMVIVHGGKLFSELSGEARWRSQKVFIPLSDDKPKNVIEDIETCGRVLFIEAELRVRESDGRCIYSPADTVSDEARGLAIVAAMSAGCSDYTFWEKP